MVIFVVRKRDDESIKVRRKEATFTEFDGMEDELRKKGIRIQDGR